MSWAVLRLTIPHPVTVARVTRRQPKRARGRRWRFRHQRLARGEGHCDWLSALDNVHSHRSLAGYAARLGEDGRVPLRHRAVASPIVSSTWTTEGFELRHVTVTPTTEPPSWSTGRAENCWVTPGDVSVAWSGVIRILATRGGPAGESASLHAPTSTIRNVKIMRMRGRRSGANQPRSLRIDVTRGLAPEDLTHRDEFPRKRSGRRVVRPLVWAAVVFLIPGCGSEEPVAPTPAGSGAVSSATPEATAVGIQVLSLGGNAVDAAVAVSLTLGVAEPSESGLGGTVVMLVTRPGADPVVIHATPEVVRTTGPTPASFLRPTMVPVLVHAWREYGSGKVSWEQVVEPAQRLAENGYSLGRFRHLMMVKEYRRLEGDSVAAALLLNSDGSIPGEGTRVQFPALAATLERLADADPDALPGGDFAELVGNDLVGLVDATAASALAAPVEAREDAPLAGSYRGWSVLVPGDPYGGPRLLRALELLQSAPVEVLEQEGESRTAWLAEALGYAIAPPEIGLDSYLDELPRLPLTVTDPGASTGAQEDWGTALIARPRCGSPASCVVALFGGGRDRYGGERDPIAGGSVRRAGFTLGFLPGPCTGGSQQGERSRFLVGAHSVDEARGDRFGAREFGRSASPVCRRTDRDRLGGWRPPGGACGRRASLASRSGPGGAPAHGSGRRDLGRPDGGLAGVTRALG